MSLDLVTGCADVRLDAWTLLLRRIRQRYWRLIQYHVNRARQMFPDVPKEDLEQEVELAIVQACQSWRRRRAAHMQYSTFLHWHLSKRLMRLDGGHVVLMRKDDLAANL